MGKSKKKKWGNPFKNPFNKTVRKAEKALSDAESVLKDSKQAIKLGVVIFAATMGLSMVSSAISIKIGLRAMKENKTREELIMFNLMKKYTELK
jgi:hypothetical protein